MPETIGGLLSEAADRDADGVWLRTDDGCLTFGGAAAQVAAVAAALRGGRSAPRRPRCGDRAHDPAVPALLAGPRRARCDHRADESAQFRCRDRRAGQADPAAGADHRRGTAPAGRRGRGRAGARRTRRGHAGGRRAGAARRRAAAAGLPAGQPGRPRGPDPNLGHHRPVQTRHADAPRVCDGG